MNGIINVLKPPGMTSQNVISFMRRTVGIKKIGHSGTLDPYAAGVLPVFIGKATRVVEYAMEGRKEYIGEICFGVETDTLDAQGRIVDKRETAIAPQDFARVLADTHGVIYQRPPMYSALKKNGQKLVDLARKGKTVEIAARPVEIYETELLETGGVNRFLFRVQCSKGTYVRTLCQDWGRALGTVAHLCFLLRTQSGAHRIEDCHTLEEIAQKQQDGTLATFLQPTESGCERLPKLALCQQARHAVLCGQPIDPAWALALPEQTDTPCQLIVGGRFMGIARLTEQGIETVKVIWEGPCDALND